MFKKILIANRGEIACRIMRSAKRLGVATVAVYSDADARASHVALADEAVRLGPPPAAESYLRADLILEAARATGADGIHPGYGFLSERESFAAACEAAGITFIGPPPQAIAAMGDKIRSKRIASEAGVSVVPGFLGEIEDAAHAVAIARDIGFPVMMKASAGGGGKGMRLAWNEADVAEGFDAVRREALASFGDDRVFIEKFIESPRHIEIQVLGDRHGTMLHLGERECSIQRRHQKVVEEAPSPFVTPQMRRAMGSQAVALAKAVGYHSAGTVELIVSGADQSGTNFYFLEMNTRLQVEHPVTELVTGLDLVEEMIRVAAGERLRLSQDDVRLDGWAIETRVYAEDPYRGFLPSTGRLARYAPPPAGPREAGGTVRIDDGVEEGSEISRFYDPMIAKLVTHASTRGAAADLQIEALNRFRIEGISHNVDFLSALMQHERFRRGELTTGFIAEEYPDGFAGVAPTDALALRLIAVAAVADWLTRRRAAAVSGQLGDPIEPSPDRVATLADREYATRVEPEGEAFRVDVDGRSQLVDTPWRPGSNLFEGTIGPEAFACILRRLRGAFALTANGATHRVTIGSARIAALRRHMIEKPKPDLSRFLLCPMPGVLAQLHVKAGDFVQAGQPLAVVEAMKMENVLRAAKAGTVTELFAKVGDGLKVDQEILEFQ